MHIVCIYAYVHKQVFYLTQYHYGLIIVSCFPTLNLTFVYYVSIRSCTCVHKCNMYGEFVVGISTVTPSYTSTQSTHMLILTEGVSSLCSEQHWQDLPSTPLSVGTDVCQTIPTPEFEPASLVQEVYIFLHVGHRGRADSQIGGARQLVVGRGDA